MGLKKYEIITVGSDKRVRALRSWQVGDRYVNIGDTGGIVYDEKTLSQDGACWLFKGNFGFPGARIGGDSIVDVAETTLSTTGTPAVDILGSSVVVGSKLQFEAEQTTADAVVLTAADFEQGDYTFVVGAKSENQKVNSASVVRIKNPIFTGGVSKTLKLDVPGYAVQAFGLDADLVMVSATANTVTGAGVTLVVPAAQYCLIRLRKDPVAPTVPADATTAAVTFTGTYETKLSIIDSRVEINPATSTGTSSIKPGGTYTIASGAKYPEAIIRNSKVSINILASTGRTFRIMGQIIGSTATLDGTTGSVAVAGLYANVKNLTASGTAAANTGVGAYNSIQAHNCNDFAVSPTIFPGLAAAQTANQPFIFQGCNVPDGRFYHHAQIANTYKNIDFALAQADLGKTFSTDRTLGSSEVNGMYRAILGGAPGPLIESHESVKNMVVVQNQEMYNTTIYKDAYFNGSFDIAGTNVFGHKVRSHPLAQVLNVAPRAVNGIFNATSVGGKITGIVNNATLACIPTPFRVNGAKGLTISNLPTGIGAAIFLTDANDVITRVQTSAAADTDLEAAGLVDTKAYIRFKKSNNDPITPADLAGVTVTVYNGCKLVNTGATAVNMKGAIRVEDNATLVNASVDGSGYFGGNAVMSGGSIKGCIYMKDNASLIRTVPSGYIRDLKMTENAYAVMGDFALNGRIHLSDNARFTPTAAGLSEGDLIMKDNAVISGAVALGGVLTMKDNAKVSAGTLSSYGDITLCGSYNQTATKSWTGKRVIDNENEPEYDNNVKSQYDL